MTVQMTGCRNHYVRVAKKINAYENFDENYNVMSDYSKYEVTNNTRSTVREPFSCQLCITVKNDKKNNLPRTSAADQEKQVHGENDIITLIIIITIIATV